MIYRHDFEIRVIRPNIQLPGLPVEQVPNGFASRLRIPFFRQDLPRIICVVSSKVLPACC
jgi:hypothetical protein